MIINKSIRYAGYLDFDAFTHTIPHFLSAVSTKDLLKQGEQQERSIQSAPSKIQRREWLQV